MSFIDVIVAKIAPHDCVGCGQEGRLLCQDCGTKLSLPPDYCYRCHITSPDSITCSDCYSIGEIFQVRAATIYTGIAEELLWKLKSGSAQEAARIMASYMQSLLSPDEQHVIMPVPTATSRYRQRGYDQAVLLARELAKCTRLPYLNCLARRGQTHQVGSNREQRIEQLSAAFRVKRPQLIQSESILLVDDVVTTGATLEAAAKVLKAAGAREVNAVTFAQSLMQVESRLF